VWQVIEQTFSEHAEHTEQGAEHTLAAMRALSEQLASVSTWQEGYEQIVCLCQTEGAAVRRFGRAWGGALQAGTSSAEAAQVADALAKNLMTGINLVLDATDDCRGFWSKLAQGTYTVSWADSENDCFPDLDLGYKNMLYV
jgi:hypothetical protein